MSGPDPAQGPGRTFVRQATAAASLAGRVTWTDAPLEAGARRGALRPRGTSVIGENDHGRGASALTRFSYSRRALRWAGTAARPWPGPSDLAGELARRGCAEVVVGVYAEQPGPHATPENPVHVSVQVFAFPDVATAQDAHKHLGDGGGSWRLTMWSARDGGGLAPQSRQGLPQLPMAVQLESPPLPDRGVGLPRRPHQRRLHRALVGRSRPQGGSLHRAAEPPRLVRFVPIVVLVQHGRVRVAQRAQGAGGRGRGGPPSAAPAPAGRAPRPGPACPRSPRPGPSTRPAARGTVAPWRTGSRARPAWRPRRSSHPRVPGSPRWPPRSSRPRAGRLPPPLPTARPRPGPSLALRPVPAPQTAPMFPEAVSGAGLWMYEPAM